MGAQQSRGNISRPAIGRIPSGSGAPRPIAPGSGMAFTGAVGVPGMRAPGQTGPPVASGDVKQVFVSR